MKLRNVFAFNQIRRVVKSIAFHRSGNSKNLTLISASWNRVLPGIVTVLALTSALSAQAGEFFVSPSGSSSGDGSSGKPWDLQTALNQPGSVKPGDTLWLRGGTYRGSFQSRLTGAQNNLITVKQYPGERAIIDGKGSSDNTLTVTGSWACYWGFEVMNSDTSRPNVQWTRPHGVTVQGPNTKFINLIVHDCGQGFGAWMEAPDAEIYGCIIYNNGNSKFDHGIYTQNSSGTKHIVDNLIFNNFGYGLHIYGSDSAYLLGYDVQGNSIFNNGSISKADAQNIIIGGGNPAERISLVDNCTYNALQGSSVTFGSDSANKDLTLRNNYFADYTAIEGWQTLNVTGNTFIAPTTVLDFVTALNPTSSSYTWNQNSYFCQELAWRPFALQTSSSSKSFDYSGWASATSFDKNSSYTKGLPSGTKVFIRPNRYEPGRAHITVFNWNNAGSVPVDLSSFLASGTRYEIRNAQDYLAAPVLSGTYNGGAVSLPMTGLSVAQPYGLSTPVATGPLFNAFVVVPLSTATSGSDQASSGQTSSGQTTTPSNTSPTISAIADQAINQDMATAAIPFVVGDAETPAANLSVLASSSNPTLVPNTGIRLSGSSASRAIAITPASGQSGTATITVSVVDGALITTRSFKLTVNAVNHAPSISVISDQSINQNTVLGPLGLTVSDAETSAGSLSVTASSSNAALIPASGIALGGSGSARTLAVTPAKNQSGSAVITVTVNDGSIASTRSFTVTVNAVNTTPTISTINNQTLTLGSSSLAVAFVIGDRETSVGSLTIWGKSSDPTVIPDGNLLFGGSGASRVVMLLPAAGRVGTATISVFVSDGALSATASFTVTVISPTIPAPVPGKFYQIVEAESGTVNSPMTVAKDGLAFQGKYITSASANTGTAAYSINIPSTGDYVIWCRILAPDGAGRGDHDSFFVSVDGAEDVYDAAEGKWAGNWQWTVVNGRGTTGTPQALSPRKFTLSAGQHSLVIRGREINSKLDSILITNDLGLTPAP